MSMYVKQYDYPVFNGLTALGTNFIEGYATKSELSTAAYWPLVTMRPEADGFVFVKPYAVNYLSVESGIDYGLHFDTDSLPENTAIMATVIIDCTTTPQSLTWDMSYMNYGTTTLQSGVLNIFHIT